MAARTDLRHTESFFDQIETAGLHNRRIRLIQVPFRIRQRFAANAQALRIFGGIIVDPLIVVHAEHVRRKTPVRTRTIHAVARIRLRRPSQYQQQFLAFVAGGHDMHFAYGPVEIDDCFAPVKHRREFDQREARFGEQQVAQFEHIRCAIFDGVSARAMLVATGRIKVDKVHRIHLTEVFHTVAAHDASLVKPQRGHIVFGQFAQVPLPFHISGLAESARQIREVHPEPARQIRHSPLRHQYVRFSRIGHP